MQLAPDGTRTYSDPRTRFEDYAREFEAAQARGVDLKDMKTWAPAAHHHLAAEAPARTRAAVDPRYSQRR